MAKVHVISTPERNAREADLVDHDADALLGSTFRLCRDIWFYLVMLNLVMGIIFIIMDVVYYDSCFLGLFPTRTVPAFLFLIGISQMSLSVIFPAFMYFLKNGRLHTIVRVPFYERSRRNSILFAGLLVALAVVVMMLFVVLGLSFASTENTCHSALVLFTQIVCSLYIIGFVALLGYGIFKKRQMPALGHFENNRTQEYSKNQVPPPNNDIRVEEDPPYPDNLSEVRLPDGHPMEDSKPRFHNTKAVALSAEFVLIRYICVVTGVIWLVSAVPGIPILALGGTFYDRCVNYRNVPNWLIVQGTFLLFGAAALVIGWCGGRGEDTKKRLLFLIPAAVCIIIVLVWPIVGVAWSDQARTLMAFDLEAEKMGCTRSFVTGVLITAAVYSIPIFIVGYILCIFILSLCIASIVIFIMWSLHEEQE